MVSFLENSFELCEKHCTWYRKSIYLQASLRVCILDSLSLGRVGIILRSWEKASFRLCVLWRSRTFAMTRCVWRSSKLCGVFFLVFLHWKENKNTQIYSKIIACVWCVVVDIKILDFLAVLFCTEKEHKSKKFYPIILVFSCVVAPFSAAFDQTRNCLWGCIYVSTCFFKCKFTAKSPKTT